MIIMAEKDEIELISDPRPLRGGGLSVKVRFNYPNGKSIELGVTTPGDSEENFWNALESLYYDMKRSATQDPQIIVDVVDSIKKTKSKKLK